MKDKVNIKRLGRYQLRFIGVEQTEIKLFVFFAVSFICKIIFVKCVCLFRAFVYIWIEFCIMLIFIFSIFVWMLLIC